MHRFLSAVLALSAITPARRPSVAAPAIRLFRPSRKYRRRCSISWCTGGPAAGMAESAELPASVTLLGPRPPSPTEATNPGPSGSADEIEIPIRGRLRCRSRSPRRCTSAEIANVLERALESLRAARSSLCMAEASARAALVRTLETYQDVDDAIKVLRMRRD